MQIARVSRFDQVNSICCWVAPIRILQAAITAAKFLNSVICAKPYDLENFYE